MSFYPLHPSPIGPKQTRTVYLINLKDGGKDDCVQEVHLGRDILEVTFKTLYLNKDEGAIHLPCEVEAGKHVSN